MGFYVILRWENELLHRQIKIINGETFLQILGYIFLKKLHVLGVAYISQPQELALSDPFYR